MKINLLAISFALVLSLTGCAGMKNSTGGVIPLGGNTYMITQQSHAGVFANTDSLRADVVAQANAFAAAQGKKIEIVSANATPAAPMHWPDFSLTFRLVP